MEHDQSNPNYKKPDYYSHNPETAEGAQPDSLGVHPSQKKKEAIVPNLLQPESPHKNLPPQLRRSNPDPDAPKLKAAKPYTFEKSSDKDTDPNAPKLPDKLREPMPYSLDTRPKTPTSPHSTIADPVPNQTPEEVVGEDIPLSPVVTLGTGIPAIEIAQNTATFDPGAKSFNAGAKGIVGQAFSKFLRQQLKARVPELGAKVLGASAADGPLPIGEALSIGFTVQSIYEIYQDYLKLQQPQTSATPSQDTPPSQSPQSIPAGSHGSITKQTPIDLGDVPQMGTATDSVDAFLKAQDAQIHQSERQMAAKQQREVQLAVSVEHRQQQRNAIDTETRDKLYKVDAQENLERYQTWLLQHDPKFLDQMNRQAGARYDTLTHQGKDLEFEGADSQQSFRKNLLSHTMQQSDIRAREMIEYSAMELNLNQVTNQGTGFDPKKLAQIRSNFDTVVAGGYAKQLEPKVIKYIETQANAAYLKETGSKEVDRNSQLWKTLRNVELLKYDRSLWETVQEAPMGMMTNPNDPSLGSNALNRPTQSSTLNVPAHTGHPAGEGQQKQQPVGGGFDTTVNPELTKQQEGFPTNQKVDGVTHVFMAKPGEIPGVDIPFRKVNPKYPANQVVLGESRALRDKVKEDKNYDCSEIAEDLLKVAKGKGKIIEVLPSGERTNLTIYEFGRRRDDMTYHQVYTDGQYVYDPRLSSEPVPKGDWEIMIRSLNPGASFDSVKMR